MITGSIVALVTPMFADGSLDLDAFRRLIDWHIGEDTDAIVAVGTTGESSTVSIEEHCELLRVAVEHAAGRIPIIAGTGGNSTAEAIELTRYAQKIGAAASLSVVPYYNKPGQEGMYRHFRTIAEAVDLSLILYNVPGRTAADLSVETTLRLAHVPGIAGIKDATGNIERGAWLLKKAPENFAVYSGDDASAIALMLLGGQGNISVTANLAPRAMHALCMAAMRGDLDTARRLHFQLLSLHKHLFVEANPIPVKWALGQIGKTNAGIRLPLTSLEIANRELIRAALREAEVTS